MGQQQQGLVRAAPQQPLRGRRRRRLLQLALLVLHHHGGRNGHDADAEGALHQNGGVLKGDDAARGGRAQLRGVGEVVQAALRQQEVAGAPLLHTGATPLVQPALPSGRKEGDRCGAAHLQSQRRGGDAGVRLAQQAG